MGEIIEVLLERKGINKNKPKMRKREKSIFLGKQKSNIFTTSIK